MTSPGRADSVRNFFHEFNSIDWRTYHTFSALSAFECFWRDTEALVAIDADRHQREQGPKWKPESDKEIAEFFGEIRAVRTAHDEVMTPTFRYAAVITLFALFERELRRAADTVAAQHKDSISYRKLPCSLLEHIRQFIRGHTDVDITQMDKVSAIHDLQKVRDCLVHCYGDAALSRDKDHLVKLGRLNRGIEVELGFEMVIQPRFIERSLGCIRIFFDDLFAELGWKVNDHWQDKLKRERKQVKR